MPKSLGMKINSTSKENLITINNDYVTQQIEYFSNLCRPSKVTILNGKSEDLEYVRKLAISTGEEKNLKIKGHTVHFDGYNDLARDKKSTKALMPPKMKLSKNINVVDRDEGLKEILQLFEGSMEGKEMLVKFYCLGPTNSKFSLGALQISDSPYVIHCEDILYRQGYEHFQFLKESNKFFTFIHSAGELNEFNVSKNTDKRRIYIDLIDGKVYSVNNQYAGNSVGLKKLALRLAIYKANNENWLAEHMLITGIKSLKNERITYFTGAYPSACGKTSTAMIPGHTIVGDDIAYLKVDTTGNCRAVNIECGIFGIIQDVNPIDDPLIYKALTTPRELIFSNVLINNGKPYWLGMGNEEIPNNGTNFFGEWYKGLKDKDGKEIPYAHSNARYTMRLNELENVDPNFNDPNGLLIKGIFYGGRDSDTNVPISEAVNWEHGVYIGATLESETTSAIIGKIGIRNSDPMANMDFLVVPLGQYLTNHINFGKKMINPPKVYSTNYFLKNNGKYTNSKLDKKVWVLWAEGRVFNEYDVIKTPIGNIPLYPDLEMLFDKVFNKKYHEDDYILQFSIRIDKYLEKIQRMEKLFENEEKMPKVFWEILNQQKSQLSELKIQTGREMLPPTYFQ